MKKLFIVAILLLGVTRMLSKEFKYYGLIGGELQIKAFINMTNKTISPHTVEAANLLIAETIAIETNNGRVPDNAPKWGEGLTQFDEGTFNLIKKRFKGSIQSKNILKACFVNVDTANYEDLRKSPMLSIVYARLLYLTKPEALPTDLEGRWLYYKKYFNSYAGKSTREQYMDAQKMAVYKVV